MTRQGRPPIRAVTLTFGFFTHSGVHWVVEYQRVLSTIGRSLSRWSLPYRNTRLLRPIPGPLSSTPSCSQKSPFFLTNQFVTEQSETERYTQTTDISATPETGTSYSYDSLFVRQGYRVTPNLSYPSLIVETQTHHFRTSGP